LGPLYSILLACFECFFVSCIFVLTAVWINGNVLLERVIFAQIFVTNYNLYLYSVSRIYRNRPEGGSSRKQQQEDPALVGCPNTQIPRKG
jgi:hypothetical protein